MDAVTARVIDKGRKNERLLIQPQYHPMPVAKEIAIIYCGVNGLLEAVPLDQVAEFENQFLQLLEAKHADDVLAELAKGKLTDDVAAKLTATAKDVAARFATK